MEKGHKEKRERRKIIKRVERGRTSPADSIRPVWEVRGVGGENRSKRSSEINSRGFGSNVE